MFSDGFDGWGRIPLVHPWICLCNIHTTGIVLKQTLLLFFTEALLDSVTEHAVDYRSANFRPIFAIHTAFYSLWFAWQSH